jgi:hypothetical protein
MQIHELTKRQRTNEGLLDTMRDGIAAVKTGYQQGGLKGAAKASVSNTAFNQATNARLQKQVANDPRIVRGRTLQQVLQAVSNDPAIKSAAGNLLKDFEQQFVSSAPTRQPPSTSNTRPTPLQQATALHQQAQSTLTPAQRSAGTVSTSVANSPQGKKMTGVYGQPKGGIQGMESDLEEAPVDPARLARMKQRARPSAPIQPTANTGPGAPGTADTELQKAVPGTPEYAKLQQQLANEPNKAAIPGEPLPPNEKEQHPANQAIKVDPIAIEKWVMSKIKGYTTDVKSDPEAAKLIDQTLEPLIQAVNSKNIKTIPTAFNNYLMAAKAATMYVAQQDLEKGQAASRAKPGDFTSGAGNTTSAKTMPNPQRQQLGINKLTAAGVNDDTIQNIKIFARTYPDVVDNLFSIDPRIQATASTKLINSGVDSAQLAILKNVATESPSLIKDVFATGLSEAEKTLAKELKTYLKSRG